MPIHGGRRGARRGLLKGSVAGEDPSPGLGPRPGSEAWVQGLSPCFCSSALRDLGMGGGGEGGAENQEAALLRRRDVPAKLAET